MRTFHRMYTWQELVALYHLSTPPWSNLEPRYNLCPTDTINVVVRGGARTRSAEVEVGGPCFNTGPRYATLRVLRLTRRLPQLEGYDLPAIPSITGRRGRRPWRGRWSTTGLMQCSNNLVINPFGATVALGGKV